MYDRITNFFIVLPHKYTKLETKLEIGRSAEIQAE